MVPYPGYFQCPRVCSCTGAAVCQSIALNTTHFLNDIIRNLKFFFRFVESGGFYVIEDFKLPELLKHLNDSDNNELIISELIEKLKKKEFFLSKILTKEDQLSLINNIKTISTYKGTMINNKINLSHVVFFEKI